MCLYSFDVFDTLITRKFATPLGVFASMQERISNENSLSSFLRNNWFEVRTSVESFIRINRMIDAKEQDISLNSIYDEIKKSYFLTSEVIEYLKQMELNIEIENIVPIKKNIDLFLDLVAKNERVVLISDMYLSSEQIRTLLLKISSKFSDVKIYVSNECNACKYNQSLYKYVKDKENVDYKDWTHYGDNKYSDVIQAKSLGINAVHSFFPNLFEYESNILKIKPENVNIQKLIGIEKLVRLKQPNINEKFEFGCSFAGPILYCYVMWIIQIALKQKIKTLHFIARDGYILKLIADLIISEKKFDIGTRYVCGSRKSWRIPNKDNIDIYLKAMLSEYTDKQGWNFFASRINLDVKDLKEILKVKRNSSFSAYKDTILKSKKLKDIIVDCNKKNFEMVGDYLRQNLDCSQNIIYFVDLNGSGKTQDFVENIIHKTINDKKDIQTFYFTLELNCQQQNSTKKFCYYYTQENYRFMIELLCRSPFGQTLGYRKGVDQKIEPVFEKTSLKIENWGFNDYLNGVLSFVKIAVKEIDFYDHDLYTSYFNYFLNEIDKKTSNIIGSIPFKEVGDEFCCGEAAPKYNLLDAVLNRRSIFHWVSMKRSKKDIQMLYIFFEKVRLMFKCFIYNRLGYIFSVRNNHEKTYKIVRILGLKIQIKRKKIKCSNE